MIKVIWLRVDGGITVESVADGRLDAALEKTAVRLDKKYGVGCRCLMVDSQIMEVLEAIATASKRYALIGNAEEVARMITIRDWVEE